MADFRIEKKKTDGRRGSSSASLEDYLDYSLFIDAHWKEICAIADARSADGFSHTPREMLQQPWIWQESGRLVVDRMGDLSSLVSGTAQICLTGAGSSWYVGESVRSFLERELKRPVVTVPTTDLILEPTAFLKPETRSLVVSFSRSGRSPESFEVARIVSEKFPEHRQLLVTCNPDSELARKYAKTPGACTLGLHPSACDQGLAMTSSFTTMVLAGQALGFLDRPTDYLAHVSESATIGTKLLAASIRAAASVDIAQFGRVCILGDGALKGAVLEGALKILEMTDGQIPTLSESFLGVRHGPLSFVDSDTLVIFSVSSHSIKRRYEADLIQTLREKGLGKHHVIVGREMSGQDALYGEAIDLACFSSYAVPDELRPPLDVLVPQVLALRFALALGLDPDNPSRRGAISRVVDGVKIYGM
ncbi:MAG: SIS domain-containing protein [Acidobacteriota bacterium]